MILDSVLRKLKRDRLSTEDHRLVAMDQSFSNFAMVLFVNGVPTDRCVFHTGDPSAKKNKNKSYGAFFLSPALQLNYMIDVVLEKLVEWNPHDISMEGLAFSAQGSSERQLGALYFGTQVILHRELGYHFDNIHTVTPTQCKATARSFMIGLDKYEREATGEVAKTRTGKVRLNPMKNKKDILKALSNTEYSWLTDGYTHDGLVASRSTPTGLYDIPDAFMIGVFTLEDIFKHKFNRPKGEINE